MNFSERIIMAQLTRPTISAFTRQDNYSALDRVVVLTRCLIERLESTLSSADSE